MFVGCQTSPTTTSTALPPTKTASPAPTATPTLVYQPASVYMENPGAWEFSHPFVFEDWGQWIVPDNEIYKLDDEYEIESVELSYQWWGLGNPYFEYQQIKRTGDVYKLNGRVVIEEKITNLIKSLNNLHAVPQTLNSVTHTDDYPIWAVEITGSDGTKILLTSDSNTPLYVPWNVIYNGDIYAQYDGSVEVALADLFSVSEGEPMAAFYPGGGEEGKLVVSTGGWPNQLNYGFNGLLPLHTAFNYWTSPETGEIIGIFDGRSSIGGFGNMVIGSIDVLERITLQKADGNKVNCDIETLESDDPSAKQWKFACSVEELNTAGSYYYPIKVIFGTDKGERITSEGNLFGYWENGILIPKTDFPTEITKVLETSEDYLLFAKDHKVVMLEMDAKLDRINERLDEAVNLDVVMLGHVVYNNKILPYSLTTSIGIEKGKVIRWDIDPLELEQLINDALKQNVTMRLLPMYSSPILNLYYFEKHSLADVGHSEGMTFAGKNEIKLPECKLFSWNNKFPSDTTTLRGYAINSNWKVYGIQMILSSNDVHLNGLRLVNFDSQTYPFASLLQKELLPQNIPPIEIYYTGWGPYIYISWRSDMDISDQEKIIKVFEQMPGDKTTYSWGLKIENAMLTINPDGEIRMSACADQSATPPPGNEVEITPPPGNE